MADLAPIIDALGEAGTAAVIGLLVGVVFGVTAQQSGFCLRSATISFWRGRPGTAFAVWLFAFCAALIGTQALVAAGALDLAAVRQLSTAGTMSGAIFGGAMFGVGMILARGCASRLLVLSATGNLRALLAGMVLTIVAQASLRGILSPLRQALSALWIVDPETRSVLVGVPTWLIFALAAIVIIGAGWLAVRTRLGAAAWICGLGVGLSVAAGWALTNLLAGQAFDVVPVESVSFSGPSADTLMALINAPVIRPSFDIGLVPGVFVGALLAAALTGRFRLEGFETGIGVPRYLAGAVLMGFGSMLAGGCAVGAGVTGGSVLALTAWVALLAMWLSAGIADWLLDRNEAPVTGALAIWQFTQRS